MFLRTIIPILLFLPVTALAVEYHCVVEKKFGSEHEYTQAEIEYGQYSLKIEDDGDSAFVSRCSFSPSAQKVTCDRYKMDKVVKDSNVKIKKYYNFQSQFDVQLYPNLSFIENNGRGGIAFGTCIVVAP